MKDYYQERPKPLAVPSRTADYGVTTEENPGERRSITDQADSTDIRDTGVGARGARHRPAGDIGSQVGIRRNLEFSAGGRSHRISTGPYTSA